MIRRFQKVQQSQFTITVLPKQLFLKERGRKWGKEGKAYKCSMLLCWSAAVIFGVQKAYDERWCSKKKVVMNLASSLYGDSAILHHFLFSRNKKIKKIGKTQANNKGELTLYGGRMFTEVSALQLEKLRHSHHWAVTVYLVCTRLAPIPWPFWMIIPHVYTPKWKRNKTAACLSVFLFGEGVNFQHASSPEHV